MITEQRKWQRGLVILLAAAVLVGAVLLGAQLVSDGSGYTAASSLGDLGLEVRTNRAFLKLGEPVLVRFTVTNFGKQTIALTSTHLPVMDLEVRPMPDERPLTTWSEQNPDQVQHRLEWQPGESKTIELTWTATQETFNRQVSFTGSVARDAGRGQAAGVYLCVGFQECP